MGLFFLISAFFLPTSVDRKGVSPAVNDRLLRLGVPLLFMTLLVFGPLTYLVDDIEGPLWRYMAFDYIAAGEFELAHLWFISLLLVFSLSYLLFRRFAPAEQIEPVATTSVPPSNNLILGLVLMLLASNAVSRIWFPVGVWVDVLPVMPVSVYINAISAIFPAQIWLLQEAVIGVAWCLSLPVLAREFWNRSNAVMQRLADDAFAVYLLHIIVIFILQEGLEETELSLGWRFTLVSMLGLLLSFLLADLVRRIPGLKRYL